MKILHTGDWHLGKQLEGVSRIEEQKLVLKDMVELVRRESVDVILIAGDIYDTFNPSSKAETLFYQTLKEMSEGGKRLIVVIPGNHDNPIRLVAASPLAKEHGIIMVDKLTTVIEADNYGNHQVLNSGPGYIEVAVNNEKAVILTLPYPSEKRLEESYYHFGLENEDQLKVYNERIRDIFMKLSSHFRDDTINIIMSHLFAMGAEETGSERSIQLGGSYIIDASCFPESADYVALGHIHKPMIVPGTQKRARYSGSPLQYNKKERHFEKGCYLLDINKDGLKDIDFHPLKVYKPIEVWKLDSIEKAIEMCEERKDDPCYVYMEIETDRFIQEHEIKMMKSLKSDILEITPVLEHLTNDYTGNITEEPIHQLFEKFYTKERQVPPTEELTTLLMQILGEEHETN